MHCEMFNSILSLYHGVQEHPLLVITKKKSLDVAKCLLEGMDLTLRATDLLEEWRNKM